MFDNYSLVLGYLNNPVFYFVLIAIILMVVVIWFYRPRRNPKPRKLTPEEQQRLTRRKRVAEYLYYEVAHLNQQERWQDNRFTELEAETEAEVETFKPSESWFERLWSGRKPLQPVMVLSEAMKVSQERYILLLGEPGGGKSIALRHLALHNAEKVAASDNLDIEIPIYINLKELERHRAEQQRQVQRELNRVELFELLEKRLSESELKTLCFCMNIEVEQFPHEGKSSLARELVLLCDRQERLHELVETCRKRHATLFRGAHVPSESQAIDRHLIHKFVMARLEQGGNRDVDEFLEEDFADEFTRGHLLFLFDSFDELPEVLSSTEEDSTISDYAKAIEGFLRAGACRGIVASRAYRGPLQTTWPKFRILLLSEKRRLELIHKANLKPQLEEELKANLSQATEGLQEMIKNPMFLGLLCEYMKSGETFPQKAHDVFESYIQSRFKRDEARLQRRFAEVSLTTLRQFAENVAFCMTADYELGLSPTRAEIKQAMTRLDFAVDSHFELCLDALEYMRLARSQSHSDGAEAASFTFAHRRFQEYFATCVVLREPERISPEQLLTNGRWRETAVTLCQSQSTDQLTPLLAECRRLLTEMVDSLPDLLADPIAYVQDPEAYAQSHELKPLRAYFFEWPAQSLHILGLLQQGFWGRMNYLPDDLRLLAARLIISAWRGSLLDREAGLEVAGIVPEPVLTWLLERAFQSDSLWLHDMAYQQAARLPHLTDDIAQGIRVSLMRLAWENILPKEKFTVMTHLSRLDRAEHFKSTAELLLGLSMVDISVQLILVGLLLIMNIIQFGVSYFWLRESIISSILFMIFHVALSAIIAICSYWFIPWRLGVGVYKISNTNEPANLLWFAVVKLLIAMIVFSLIDPEYIINSIFIIYVFALVWIYSAIISLDQGLAIPKNKWHMLPINLMIYYLIKLPKTLLHDLIVGVIRLIVFVISCFAIAIIAYFLWLNTALFVREVVKSAIFAFLIIISVAYALFIGFISIFFILAPIDWFKQRFYYRHWKVKNQVMLKGSAFLELISDNNIIDYRTQIMQAIHKQNLLINNEETENILGNLLIIIEIDRKKYRLPENVVTKDEFISKKIISHYQATLLYVLELTKRPSKAKKGSIEHAKLLAELASLEQIELPPSDVFTAWYQRYTAKDKYRLGRWTAQDVDELSKLLKQVQANRAKK